MRPEDALRHARDTVGQMPAATVRDKLARIQAGREARDQREILRLREELDAVELDEVAYRAGVRSEKAGDLREAARWYRAAAISDFPGASLKLAKTLDFLASEYLDGPGVLTAQEAELVSQAAYWYLTAVAAGETDGETEADDLLDDLIPRHDPDRHRPSTSAATPSQVVRAPQEVHMPHVDPVPQEVVAEGSDECPLGGLQNAAKLEDPELRQHFADCQHCRSRVLGMLAGMVPSPRPRVSPRALRRGGRNDAHDGPARGRNAGHGKLPYLGPRPAHGGRGSSRDRHPQFPSAAR